MLMEMNVYQSVNDTIYHEAPDGGFYRWETDNIGEKMVIGMMFLK